MKANEAAALIGQEVVALHRTNGSLRALGSAGGWRLVGIEKGHAIIERRDTHRIPLATIESLREFK